MQSKKIENIMLIKSNSSATNKMPTEPESQTRKEIYGDTDTVKIAVALITNLVQGRAFGYAAYWLWLWRNGQSSESNVAVTRTRLTTIQVTIEDFERMHDLARTWDNSWGFYFGICPGNVCPVRVREG